MTMCGAQCFKAIPFHSREILLSRYLQTPRRTGWPFMLFLDKSPQ